jgi:glycosyltransferase involved in cell wall biosynthesis
MPERLWPLRFLLTVPPAHFYSLTRLPITDYHFTVTLSVVIITFNEEANLPRTLASVTWADEIIVVDSGSTDRTLEIAKSCNTKVWVEPWKGFAAQKNSAIEKATSDWVLSLDADEEVSTELKTDIGNVICDRSPREGYSIPRRNMFLGRFIRHGGFYPDAKLRLFRRGAAQFESRLVHEDAQLDGTAGTLGGDLIHHSYPTLSSYIEHMNRYSSLGAEMAVSKGKRGFSFVNIVLRPLFTFIYNYFFRLGFLDGREGLLLHLYHSVYVSWKYAKLWEISRKDL